MIADRDAFVRVTTGYYLTPEPAMAAQALREWLAMVDAVENDELASMMALFYLFARISQVSPASAAAFAPILGTYTGRHAELVKRLRGIDASFPNAEAQPIDGPESLDLLWAEFFVTGHAGPIVKIASALDWLDVVRGGLDAWLQERSWFGGGKRRASAAALAAAGIHVDLEQRRIVTEGDLDCLCCSIAQRQIPIFQILPCELTGPELLRAATKGSAAWSLSLNAASHERVAAVCRTESSKPGGPARTLIKEAVDGRPFAL